MLGSLEAGRPGGNEAMKLEDCGAGKYLLQNLRRVPWVLRLLHST